MVSSILASPDSVGQSFQREMAKSTEEAQEYRGLLTHEAKKEWRQKWLKRKFDGAMKKYQKKTKMTILEQTEGVYLPFRRVWEMEGLDQDGLKALGNESKIER